MNNTDVIMATLENCNKLRAAMVKDGAPDAGAYEQLNKIEMFCLAENEQKNDDELTLPVYLEIEEGCTGSPVVPTVSPTASMNRPNDDALDRAIEEMRGL